MLHVFTCPALRNEQNDFREQMNVVFRKWALPYCDIGKLPSTNILQSWTSALQERFRKKHQDKFSLTGEKIHQLVEDYWQANVSNRHKTLQNVQKSIEETIRRYHCSCLGRHVCQLRNCWMTPATLTRLLQEHFSLEVEGMADALHRSRHLHTWFSAYER